jgi:hypothetical protein
LHQAYWSFNLKIKMFIHGDSDMVFITLLYYGLGGPDPYSLDVLYYSNSFCVMCYMYVENHGCMW